MALPTRLTQASAKEYLSQGTWQPFTLSDYWDRNASQNPRGIAVADGRRSLTWAEARLWTDRVALALIRLGLRRDEVLIVQLPNCIELPLIRVACEKAGVLCLPVPHTLRRTEISYSLRHTQGRAVAVPAKYRGFDYFGMYRELQTEFDCLNHILVIGDEAPKGAISLEEISRYPSEGGEDLAILDKRRYKATELSLINATTGSTGLPKFAEYTAAARLLYGRAYVDLFGLGKEDVIAALSPAAGGPNIPVYFAAPQVGAKTVFLNHFEAEAAFELIQKEKVTLACLVPAQLALMVSHPHPDHYDLSSIRFWLSVGAPLPSSLAQETEEKLGAVVLNTYGAVDWGGVVFTSPSDPEEVRYFTVGRPRFETEVRLVNEEGKIAAEGEIGEVQGRGPSCSGGYYRDPEMTQKAWTTDGWLCLGDLGRWDERGNLVVVGRKDELIIRGGQNICPGEVENFLLSHPKVRQAAVVAMPHPVMGEKVCAYIVPKPSMSLNLEEIVSFLESKMIAPYKLPERLELVESLPMVSDTKINKRLLAADVAEKIRKGR